MELTFICGDCGAELDGDLTSTGKVIIDLCEKCYENAIKEGEDNVDDRYDEGFDAGYDAGKADASDNE